MNLIRLAAIAAAVWLALYVLRRLFHRPASDTTPRSGSAENMVRCAQCGLHLPEAEAIAHEGRHFCCEAHRRQYHPPP